MSVQYSAGATGRCDGSQPPGHPLAPVCSVSGGPLGEYDGTGAPAASTPIASPGTASLEAALHPAHGDLLYYVLCGADGHHKFSKSYATFRHDVATCLG